MSVWTLAFFYTLHLIATVIWLGGLALLVLIAWPAWQQRQEQLNGNSWFQLQRRFVPWINGSMIVLLLTGFVQMTNDPDYSGFLQVDSLWGQAILAKHVAFVVMVGITIYLQVSLYPAGERLQLLRQQRPQLAAVELAKIGRQEIRLLRWNLICALVVLFCTAVATAV